MCNVFVDTQAYEAQGFGFKESASLKLLANAVADKRITVLLTSVTDREVRRRISSRITEAFAAVKKLYPLKALSVVDVKPLTELTVEQAVGDVLAQWERYKKKIKAKMVDIDLGKPSSVMDAHFGLAPPFSKDKPNEFRDAFVLDALRAWAKKKHTKVYVVSGDPDHKNACDEKVLLHEPNIVEVLARCPPTQALLEKLLDRAKDLGAAQRAVVEERIKEEIESLHAVIEADYDADVSAITASAVEIDPSELELIELPPTGLLLSGTATARVDVEATVSDYDNGSRDEGDWVILPQHEMKFSSDVEVTFLLSISRRGQSLVEIAEVSVEEPKSLSVDDDWSSIITKNWFDDDEPD